VVFGTGHKLASACLTLDTFNMSYEA
jgi:hypothetical protein